MIIRVVKILSVVAIITGLFWMIGAVGNDDFLTNNGVAAPFGQTMREMGRGLAIAGAGAIARFCAAWYEYEQKQKNKNGRRASK